MNQNQNILVGTTSVVDVSATTGAITMASGTITGNGFGVGGSSITYTANTNFTVATLTMGAGTSTNQVFVRDFGGTINATANATTGNVYLFDDSPLSLGAISAGTTSGTVQIFGWAAIEDANGALTNITAKDAILLAGQPGGSTTGGIGSGDALETAVANIAFGNPDTGSTSHVQISNTGALTVASLGALTTSSNAAGSITLLATDNLTVNVGLDPTTVTLNSDDDVIINAAVTANNLIDINAGLDGSGSATVGTGGTLTVTLANSDITIDAGTSSGDIALNGTSTSVTAVDNVALNASAGAITTSNSTSDVSAVTLTASSATGIELDTTITTLTSANVTGTGAIDISDTAGGLAVSSATTADGAITLNATGGNLTLTIVTAVGTSRDINATTTASGDIQVGNVTATSDTITLNSAGAIEEIGGGDAGSDLTARVLSLTAATGIGGLAQIEIDTNTASGDGLTASVTGTGAINLRDVDGMRVNSAVTNDGSITLEGANGSLTLTTVTAVGTGATIVANTLAGSGNISVGVLTASGDSVTLSAFTNITDGNTTSNNVTADSLSASSATGVDLDTTITTLTNASASGIGAIDINDLAGGLVVTSATTADGAITLNAAGGDLTLTTVTATGTSRNVVASTTTSGHILVNSVTAAGDNIQLTSAGAINETAADGTADLTSGTATLSAATGIGGTGTIEVDFTTLTSATVSGTGVIDLSDTATGLTVTLATTNDGTITLNATTLMTDDIQLTIAAAGAGTIEESGNDVGADLTSATATLTSRAGVGTLGILEVNFTTLTSVSSALAAGTINISDTAGGLTVTSATTADGAITLNATSGNLTLTSVSAGGTSRDVVATTTTSGNIVLDSVSAGGDGVRLASVGSITDNNTTANNVTALSLQLVAASGIGSTDAIETTVTNLAASNSTSTNIQVVNTGALTITSVGPIGGATVVGVTNSAAGGTISIQANSPLTISSAVSGPGDILLQAGNSTSDDDDLTISANITSTGGGLIELIAGDDVSQTTATISSTGGATNRVEITADNEGAGGDTDRGGITQSGGNVVTAEIVFRAFEGVDFDTSTTNNVAEIAATVTGADAVFEYEDADSVDVDSVDGVNGITTAGGNVLVDATSGTITVDQAIDTTGGTGTGGISITGAVVLNAALDADGGSITLHGNNTAEADLDINASLTSSDSMTLSALRDVLIGALVKTTGSGSDITITADTNSSGLGGVRVETAGQVDSADQVTISGSDLNAVAGVQSVQVDSDGATAQVKGAGAIAISSGASAATTADIVINGFVQGSSTSTVSITANEDVTFGVDGDITTNNGTITVTADNATGNVGVITMANGTVFTAGTNSTTTLTADGSVTLGAIDSGSGLVKVTSTSGAILDADAVTAVDITAGTAALRAKTGVGSNADAIETSGTLTFAAVTDSGDIHVSNTGSLTVGTVDSLVGVTIQDTATTNPGGDITIVAASPLTVDSAILNAAGGDIFLTASGATAADDLTLNATVTATGGSGEIELNAGSDIIQNANGDISAAGTGVLDFNAGTGTTDGVITQANGATAVTVTGLITMDADGDITLANVQTGNATTSAVILTTTAGGVLDAGDIDVDVIAASGRLVIDAATGIGSSGNGLETTVSSLDLDNATSGNIQINETNAVTVFDAQQATAGNISIVAGGTITVDDGAGAATVITAVGAGTISLDANGASSDIVLTDGIQSATGSITLTADNDVTAGADGDITSASGNLQVTADVSSGSTSTIFMNGGTLWNAGSGTIDLDTDGSITLGGLATTSASLTAVTIDTTAGAVADGGNTFVNIVADSGRVVINARTGVGSGDALETTVASLDVENSNSGDINLNETNAVTVTLLREIAAGNISLVAGGTITVNAGVAGQQTVVITSTGNVSIDANGAASDIVLNDGISTITGNITLTADNDVTADSYGNITAFSVGDLSVTADVSSGSTSVITMADGALWDAGTTGTITLATDGDITLSGLKTIGPASAVSITTTGGGVFDAGDAYFEIYAEGVTISAATGVGSSNALETEIHELVLTNSTSGNVDLLEFSELIVRQLTQSAATGTVTINTNDGSITIQDAQAGVSSQGGAILINANGFLLLADVVNNDSITSTSGSITITADDDITFDADSDISSTSGNVILTADFDANSNGEILMTDGSFVNAGLGTITASAYDSITLARFVTTNNTGTAVAITSTAGGLIDGGDTNTDNIEATGASAVVTITTATGIGHAAPVGGAASHAIETEITTLNASVTGTGGIDINELDAIVLFDVDTNNGSITVDANGQITATDVVSSTDNDANDIILDTNSGNIVVTLINAGTANGDVLLDAAGSITESAVDTAVKITADGLRLVTGTGGVASETGTVSTALATTLLDTAVNELEASIGASGLFLVNTQALNLLDQDLLGTGNDSFDRDGNGATAVTSTSGTVRVNTTAGSLTFGELVNATGQLASFNAVGIFSDADGNSSSS
ncbi:MAG: hypothetical protein FD138_590, partial [Planctomycetota bacterium]